MEHELLPESATAATPSEEAEGAAADALRKKDQDEHFRQTYGKSSAKARSDYYASLLSGGNDDEPDIPGSGAEVVEIERMRDVSRAVRMQDETFMSESAFLAPASAKSRYDYNVAPGSDETTLLPSKLGYSSVRKAEPAPLLLETKPLFEAGHRSEAKSKTRTAAPKLKVLKKAEGLLLFHMIMIKGERTDPVRAKEVLDRLMVAAANMEGANVFVSQYKSPFRCRGNLTTAYEGARFEMQVVVLAASGETPAQLAVELKHLCRNGRNAFAMLLEHLSWSLHVGGFSSFMADGTDIIMPSRIREMRMMKEPGRLESATEEGVEDSEDDLSMPFLSCLSGYAPHRSSRRGRTGIKFYKNREDSEELQQHYLVMIRDRGCPDTLKTIARCTENERNAEVLGANQELVLEIVKLLEPKPSTFDRDQQTIYCALLIISNILYYAVDLLAKSGLVDHLVDNLLYFASPSKERYFQSEAIQNVSIQSLSALMDKTRIPVSEESKKKLSTALTNMRKISKEESVKGLEEFCSQIGVLIE